MRKLAAFHPHFALGLATLTGCAIAGPDLNAPGSLAGDGTSSPPQAGPSSDAGLDGMTGQDASTAVDSGGGSSMDAAGALTPDANDASAAPDAAVDAASEPPADANEPDAAPPPATCPATPLSLSGDGDAPRVASVTANTARGGSETAGSCRATDAPEWAYTLTADVDGRLTATLRPTGFDAVLHARTECSSPQSEVACSDAAGSGDEESIQLWVRKDTRYTLIVDGYSGDSGEFALDVELVPQADSEACDGEALTWTGNDPYTVSVTGDTRERRDDLTPSCGSSSAADAVYALTPPKPGVLTVTATPTEGFDTVLSLRTSCSDSGSEVACRDGSGAGARETVRQFVAAANTTYYATVDGYGSGAGSYTLEARLDSGDPDTCPGELLTFAGSPPAASASGNLSGLGRDHVGYCVDELGAADAVHFFVAPQTGTATVHLSAPEIDPLFFVGTRCGGDDVVCRDVGGVGVAEQISIETTAGTTYFVVAEGYYGGEAPYMLTVAYE